MDDDALRSAFLAHTTGHAKFTRRMAITMANNAGVTPRQMILRLERSGLLRPGSWDWFAENGGITKEQVAEVTADDLASLESAVRAKLREIPPWTLRWGYQIRSTVWASLSDMARKSEQEAKP